MTLFIYKSGTIIKNYKKRVIHEKFKRRIWQQIKKLEEK